MPRIDSILQQDFSKQTDHQQKVAAQGNFWVSVDQGKREEIPNQVATALIQREAKKTWHLNLRRRKRKASRQKVINNPHFQSDKMEFVVLPKGLYRARFQFPGLVCYTYGETIGDS